MSFWTISLIVIGTATAVSWMFKAIDWLEQPAKGRK